jgi:hypothetical protein
MSTYSASVLIAEQLNEKWGVNWITPLTVQIFIVLSNPVRQFIAAFITQKKATLLVAKQKYIQQSMKGNTLADAMGKLRVATALLTNPISQFLKVFPLDTIVKDVVSPEVFAGSLTASTQAYTSTSASTQLNALSQLSPDFSDFIMQATGAIPLQIDASIINMIPGFAGFDFFQGINNFSDLASKIQDLEFRAARAIALSTYATAEAASIDTLLNKSDVYLDIITTLDTQGL